MSAAFARAVRMGVLSRPQALRNLSRFQQDWFDLFRIDVSEALVAQADALAWLHTLRGYDAIHLAAALAWQNELGEPVAIATYDQQLWTASNEARLIVYPPQL
jgi:predicted nucleic acid-binding protein